MPYLLLKPPHPNRPAMHNITAFEHRPVYIGGKEKLTREMTDELLAFRHVDGRRFCAEIHNGIKFQQFVGIVRTESVQVEILPKTTKDKDKAVWQKALINLLHACGKLDFEAVSEAHTDSSGNLFDILLLQYCLEIAKLLHRGLIKRYRRHAGNTTALKGKLLFAKHIKHNAVHAERFYTEHTVYDKTHPANQVLRAALALLPRLSNDPAVCAEARRLLLDFPEMDTPAKPLLLFRRIRADKKLQPYSKALHYARMILQGHHPDISTGNDLSFALLFDMNKLFEAYVAERLRLHTEKCGWRIETQRVKKLWSTGAVHIRHKPDILVFEGDSDNCLAAFDTKWKIINLEIDISASDLRQVYAYCKSWRTKKGFLLYPSNPSINSGGNKFSPGNYFNAEGTCTVSWLKILDPDKDATFPQSERYLCDNWIKELIAQVKDL